MGRASPRASNSRALPMTARSKAMPVIFNREDMGHDVIAPGAFRESLKERGASGVKMLFQHNPAEMIGVWDEIREDARGLFVRGRLMQEVSRAREILSLMRAGALDGLSIGFKALRGKRDARSGVRRIEKVDLWEISVVTFPMLPDARVAAVKSRPFNLRVPANANSNAGSRGTLGYRASRREQ